MGRFDELIEKDTKIGKNRNRKDTGKLESDAPDILDKKSRKNSVRKKADEVDGEDVQEKKQIKEKKSEEAILLESVEEAIINKFGLYENEILEIKKEIFNQFKKKLSEYSVIGKKKEHRKLTSFQKEQFARVQKIEEIGIPEKEGEQLRFVTTSSLNIIQFVLYMIDLFGSIDEFTISYFSLGTKICDIFEMILNDGKIKKMHIQTSTLRGTADEYKTVDKVKLLIQKYGREIISADLAWIHTKVMCFKIGDDFYTIEGSGNLSNNARVEQYVFSKSKAVYNFHYDWIKNIKDFSANKDVVTL